MPKVLQSMSVKDPFRWDQTLEGGPLATVKTLRQEFILMPGNVRDAYMVYLARSYSNDNVSLILFCDTVDECSMVFHMMEALLDCACVQLNSFMRQKKRNEALNAFRSGQAKVLVATDVASRGLDIPMTDLVINCSCPPEV